MKLYLISMKDIDYPLGWIGEYYGFVVKAHNIAEAMNSANLTARKIYDHVREKGLAFTYNNYKAITDDSGELVFDENGVSQPFYFFE